ncbi:hypothetical protein ACI79D_05540 [Geodermatophilus sp. SYSU D00708]
MKWSAEPASATDVPRTISQAAHNALLEPQGPVFVSVPYDDWAQEAGPDSEHLADRAVAQAAWPSPAQVDELVAVLSAARNPVLVGGSGGRGGRERAGRRARRTDADAGLDRAVGVAVPVPHPARLVPRRPAGGGARHLHAAGRPRPQSQPELVEAFRSAMNRSLEFCRQNPDEVRRVIGTYTQLAPKLIVNLTLPVYRTEVNQEALTALGASAVEYGTLKAEPDLDALLW